MELDELIQIVDQGVVEVLTAAQRPRVLELVVHRVDAFFFGFELDALLKAFVPDARLSEEQIHRVCQLVNLIRENRLRRAFLLPLPASVRTCFLVEEDRLVDHACDLVRRPLLPLGVL